MHIYRTAEIAAAIGIHPNTVRLYETLGLIPKPERQANGYRIFTEYHIEQLRLVRLAFQIEVLQNGLRKKAVQIVKASAAGDFDNALVLAEEYREQIREERSNAEEAVGIAAQIMSGGEEENTSCLKRKEVSELLHISMDTLRNWEMNGLLTVKRRANGYRIYTDGDIRRLKMVRALRCANYSLEAILRMLGQLSQNPEADIKEVLNTPPEDAEIITVCDKLIDSLTDAEQNAGKMIDQLGKMKQFFFDEKEERDAGSDLCKGLEKTLW